MGNGTWEALKRVIVNEVGYREGKENANKFSTQLGRPAESWCADFCVATQETAGVVPISRSAYTPSQEIEYARAGRLGQTPRVGAQFFVYSAKDRRIIHTGFVIEILSDNRVRTLEGNTNDDGSANGNGVYVRIRQALKTGPSGIRSYGYPNYKPPVKPPVKTAPKPPRVAPVDNGIKSLQKLLRCPQDGIWGTATNLRVEALRKAALGAYPWGKRFVQSVVGAKQDGVIGPDTQARLKQTIMGVQKVLGASPDGVWGANTEARYQAARKRFFH